MKAKGKLAADDNDTPATFWFPKSWEAMDNIENVRRARGQEPLRGFENIVEGDGDLGGVRRLRIMVIGGSASLEVNPLLKAIKEILDDLDIDFETTPPSEGAWSKNADIILFDSRFDHRIGDPTQLLIPQGANLADVEPSDAGKQDLRSLMAQMSTRIFTSGPNNEHMIQNVGTVQEELLESRFLFPLYKVPYYVFYRTDRIKNPQVNFRSGFVNLAEWEIKAECPKSRRRMARKKRRKPPRPNRDPEG